MTKKDKQIASYELDNPLTDIKDDKLGYANFAQKTAEALYSRNSQQSVVVSINAPWGNGKSTCMNFIKTNLEKHNDVEILDFNPWWFSSNQEDLVANFFLSLKPYVQKLYKLSQITAKQKDGFFNLLSGFTIKTKLFNYNCNNIAQAFMEKSSITEEKEKIDKFLKRYKKKLFIFIDDIDRLNVPEILQLFRLVKSVANFSNITYILAFDKELVASVLQEEQLIDGDRYLEKIIQIPLNLPMPGKSNIERLLVAKLNSIDTEYVATDTDRDVWANAYAEVIQHKIKNPRDINRLYNAIITTYPMIKDDVNFIDFVIIEFVRIFFPKLWEALAGNQEFFTKRSSSYSDKKAEQDALDSILKDYSGKEKDYCLSLIDILFPDTRWIIDKPRGFEATCFSDMSRVEWTKERRVCSKERFPYYFSFRLNDEDISDGEINRVLDSIKNIGDLLNIFRRYDENKSSNGDGKLGTLLEKLWYYPQKIKELGLMDVFFQGIFIGGSYYVGGEKDYGAFYTTDNSIRFQRLFYQLYCLNSHDENFNMLKNVIKNPETLEFSCKEMGSLGEGLGLFGSKETYENTCVNLEQFNELAEIYIKTVEENYFKILSCEHPIWIINFVHKFDAELADRIFKKITSSDEEYLKLLNSLYYNNRSQVIGSVNVKIIRMISVKSVERWISCDEVKQRLEKIIKNTHNKESKKLAKNILYDINNPPESDWK